MRAVAPTQLSSGTDRSASVRQVGRRIAAVLVLVAAILGLPVMTPTATTVLAVAHAACPPDCGGGSNGSNGGPPGGGTEFMPPQMPQPPNINGGYNYPAPDQANGISIYNQPPAGQGSAPPNAASPQAGQSWQTAANGEQQPAQYQSAPHTEQLSKQFTDLQNLLKQDMDVDDPSPFHHHAPLTVHPGGTPENGVDPETGAHVLPGEGEEGGGMRQAAPTRAGDLTSTATKIGKEVDSIPKGSGQLQALATKVTDLHLSQTDAVQVTDAASKAAFGETGGTARLPDGTKVVLPKLLSQQTAMLVHPDGSVAVFRGDLNQFLPYIGR
jgi:hypothetical protein